MMTVKIDDRDYDVTFSHFSDELYYEGTPEHLLGAFRQQTAATFYEVVDGKRGEVVVGGIAVTHPNDNFSRSKGRKVAFGYALQAFPKETRQSAWDQYFAKFGRKN